MVNFTGISWRNLPDGNWPNATVEISLPFDESGVGGGVQQRGKIGKFTLR